jgi:hypothetical protein
VAPTKSPAHSLARSVGAAGAGDLPPGPSSKQKEKSRCVGFDRAERASPIADFHCRLPPTIAIGEFVMRAADLVVPIKPKEIAEHRAAVLGASSALAGVREVREPIRRSQDGEKLNNFSSNRRKSRRGDEKCCAAGGDRPGAGCLELFYCIICSLERFHFIVLAGHHRQVARIPHHADERAWASAYT